MRFQNDISCILLLCYLCNVYSVSRLVVTFNHSSSEVVIPGGLHVVKQYGRRLVIELPWEANEEDVNYTRAIWPDVVDVEYDLAVFTAQVYTNDTQNVVGEMSNGLTPFGQTQWNLFGTWGLGLTGNETGNGTVAILDTGFDTEYGYDFVSNVMNSGDGDGRDPNATDPGGTTDKCPSPSWHGTKMASVVRGYPGVMYGVAPGATLLSLRVLGNCATGTASDITDAIVWAVGGTIHGIPNNSNPSKIISMSLSGKGGCPSFLQSAVNQALDTGAVVIAAAGNNADDSANYFPGNCEGVISVGASTINGSLAAYSNWGVTFAAPGGDPENPIQVMTPTGLTYSYGTSLAAPHVAGMVILTGRMLLLKQLVNCPQNKCGFGIISMNGEKTSISNTNTTRISMIDTCFTVEEYCIVRIAATDRGSTGGCCVRELLICPYGSIVKYLVGIGGDGSYMNNLAYYCAPLSVDFNTYNWWTLETMVTNGQSSKKYYSGPLSSGLQSLRVRYASNQQWITDIKLDGTNWFTNNGNGNEVLLSCGAGEYIVGLQGGGNSYTDTALTGLKIWCDYLPCNACAPGQYISSSCSASTQTSCSACSQCTAGTQYISSACSGSSDTQCSACSQCTAGTQYISSACSGSSNTQCAICSTCPTGKYISTGCGTSSDKVCTACDPGKYMHYTDWDYCFPCYQGKYGTISGAPSSDTSCTNLCAAGTYGNTTGNTLRSQACPYSCPGGTYGTALGATSAAKGCNNMCAAGTYGTALGATSLSTGCNKCAAGTYATELGANRLSMCTLCASGTYGTALGTTSTSTGCNNTCASGTYGTALGATSLATACPGNCTPVAGTYWSGTGAISATNCSSLPCTNTAAAGYYYSSNGIGNSTVCQVSRCTNTAAAGYYYSSNGIGNSTVCQVTACTTPTTGMYISSGVNVTACTYANITACGMGYMVTNLTTSGGLQTLPGVCMQCPTGSISSDPIQNYNCTKCPAGQIPTTLSVCSPCTPGFYSAYAGAAACTNCTNLPNSETGTAEYDSLFSGWNNSQCPIKCRNYDTETWNYTIQKCVSNIPPATTSTTSQPATTSTTSQPATTGTTSQPATASTTSQPATTSTTSPSATTSTTSQPATTSTTSPSATTSTTSQPVTTSTTSQPATTSTTSQPATTSTTSQPATTSTTSQPATASTTSPPATTSTTSPSATTSTTSQPATTSRASNHYISIVMHVPYNESVFISVWPNITVAFQTLLNITDSSRITARYTPVLLPVRRLLQIGGTVEVNVTYPTQPSVSQAYSLLSLNTILSALMEQNLPLATAVGFAMDALGKPETATPPSAVTSSTTEVKPASTTTINSPATTQTSTDTTDSVTTSSTPAPASNTTDARIPVALMVGIIVPSVAVLLTAIITIIVLLYCKPTTRGTIQPPAIHSANGTQAEDTPTKDAQVPMRQNTQYSITQRKDPTAVTIDITPHQQHRLQYSSRVQHHRDE